MAEGQEVQELRDRITKYLEMEKVAELLSKNVIEFEHDGGSYRLSRPTFKQKVDVNDKRIERFTELLKNTKYLFEKDIIKLYRDRGIDIDAMTDESRTLTKQNNDLMMKLGEALKAQAPDNELQLLKTEIKKINERVQEITIQKILYLDSSIESQVEIFIYTYYGFLLTDKKVNDAWVKAWSTYEDFMDSSESLINTITYYVSFIAKTDVK